MLHCQKSYNLAHRPDEHQANASPSDAPGAFGSGTRPGSTSVKLHSPSTQAFYNTFTAYGDGYVEVNQQRFESSIIVLPEVAIQPWPVARFADLRAEHFVALSGLAPEVVIFGSGAKLRFPPAALLAPLMQSRIGFESMDTHAACRTYNILMSEGRRVACAILIEPQGALP